MESVICGIDPGLSLTGYAVLRAASGSLSVIDAGVCHASIATDNGWLGHLEVTQQGMIANLRMVNFVVQWGQRSWSYTVSVRNDGNAAVAYHLRVARLLP